MKPSQEIFPAAQLILSWSAPSLTEAKLLWGLRALTIFETLPEVPDFSMHPKTIVLCHPWCFWWTEVGCSFDFSTPHPQPPRSMASPLGSLDLS